MADELLSQAELETLLSNSKSGLAPKVRDSAGHGVPAPHRSRSVKSAPQFKSRATSAPREVRPSRRLTQESMAAIRSLHEVFGRGASAALSAQLHSEVEVKLAWVEQLAYGEFVSRLSNPTCASLVRARPLAPDWILDISPPILYAIIDRLLGGGGQGCQVARRPLTEIELRLASRIARLLLAELRQAWRPVLELDFALDRVESNPRLALVVPSDAAVVLVGFEARLNLVRGTLCLCIPLGSLEPIVGKLASGTAAGRLSSPSGETGAAAAVELVVRLAETKIAAHEMHNLRVGDIITTETDVEGPLAVSLDGIPAFLARPGTHDARKAVRIEDPLAGPAADELPE